MRTEATIVERRENEACRRPSFTSSPTPRTSGASIRSSASRLATTKAKPVAMTEISCFRVSSLTFPPRSSLLRRPTVRAREKGSTRCRRSLPGVRQGQASALIVEAGELGAEHAADAEAGVAVDAEDDLLRAPRVQVVLHHKIQKLHITVPDLIHELRKRDAARDQTLARLAGVEFAESPVGMPDDKPGDDVPPPPPGT